MTASEHKKRLGGSKKTNWEAGGRLMSRTLASTL